MQGLQLVYDDHAVYLWLGSLALLAILAAWLWILNSRLSSIVAHYRLLSRGVGSGSLQALLERHLERLEATAERLDEVADGQLELERVLAKALRHVGVVRFNSYSDVGGDQSFSVALLDSAGCGVVFSSLYGRKESRMYVKPVENHSSKYALSAEEEQAIRLAAKGPAAQRAR